MILFSHQLLIIFIWFIGTGKSDLINHRLVLYDSGLGYPFIVYCCCQNILLMDESVESESSLSSDAVFLLIKLITLRTALLLT